MKRRTRLDQLLARNLGLPRRAADDLIESGRLLGRDGSRFADARTAIDEADLPLEVRLDGEALALHDHFHLLLHKPVGCVTAVRDSVHATAFSYLRDAPLFDELRAIGRLDLETCGLLLFTTDGQWLHRMTHPRSRVPRVYQAALARPFRAPDSELVLEDGHRPHILSWNLLAADRIHPALPRAAEATVYAEISLLGGAYHEVRRIFAALGSHVLSLCRTRHGSYALPADLPAGAWQPVLPVG